MLMFEGEEGGENDRNSAQRISNTSATLSDATQVGVTQSNKIRQIWIVIYDPRAFKDKIGHCLTSADIDCDLYDVNPYGRCRRR